MFSLLIRNYAFRNQGTDGTEVQRISTVVRISPAEPEMPAGQLHSLM
jgi:hypothetical protein